MQFLKTNTAVRITVGPFLDSTDGVTPETALTVTNCTCELYYDDDDNTATHRTAITLSASGGNNDMVHITDDAGGYYDLELTAAQLNFTGRAVLSIIDTDVHLPVFKEFTVLSANVYDSLFAGAGVTADLLDVNASQLGGTGQTGRDIGASVLLSSGTGTGQISLSSGTVTAGAISANAITATAIQDGAITNAKVADDVDVNVKTITADAITAAAIAADASTEINAAVLSAISGIGSGTGATLNFEVADDNTGTTSDTILDSVSQLGNAGATTFANTQADNGVYHTIASVTDTTEKIDWVYRFDAGGGRNASKVVLRAFMSAVTDTVTIQVYDHVGTDWESVGSITGTTETLYDIPLYSKHTGSGANAGKVYIRFVFNEADAGTLNIDIAYVQAQNLGQTVGYSSGCIWVDTVGGTAGTTPFVNGVADHPVNTWADALTLNTALGGINRFHIAAGSSITLTADSSEYSLLADGLFTLALGGQDISNSYILHATVSGTGAGSGTIFDDCLITASTSTGPAYFVRCGFNTPTGTPYTAAGNGQYVFVDCVSTVAGSGTPYFDFSPVSGTTGINFRRWSGGSNITLDTNCTLTMEVVTGGGQTIACGGASGVEVRGICRAVTLNTITSATTAQIACVTGPITLGGADGTVNIYGVCSSVTDNRTGTPTLNTYADIHSDVATVDGVVDAILDDTGTAGVVVASLAANSVTASALAADAGTEIGTAVWASSTRTLTALDEDNTTIDIDSAIAAAVPSAATIADAVWDEASTGHIDAGKAGAQLWTDIDAILVDTGTDIPASLTTIDDYIDSEIGTIVTAVGTTIPALIDAVPTATEIWTLASAVDGKTPQQALRYIAAALAGEISGAGTGTEKAYGLDGTTERVRYTVDESGNRTAVSYDP